MALFSVAEARAFDKAQLADAVAYPDLDITTKEAEIREWLARVCGVDFQSTSHTEQHDGDGSDYLILKWPRPTEVTALSIDGTSIDAAYLSATDYGIGMALDETGMVTWRGGTFTAGWKNVEITYTAGYTTPPALVKRAALMLCVNELPADNTPWQADGFEAGGTTYSWTRGDGYAGNWSQIPDVMRAIRAYSHRPPAVA